MSKKVDFDLLKAVMQRQELDVRQIARIFEEINQELAAMVDDDDKEPAIKKQFVILVSDPRGILTGKDLTGWVLQIAESESPATAEAGIIAATREFNTTPKGRRLPVKTIAEACEHVPSRFLKSHGVSVRTKEPVYVVATSNKL